MEDININVKVIPQGKFNRVESAVLDNDNRINLKVRVTAVPADGKANEAVIKLLAEYYKVSKSSFYITSGLTSRNKIITVRNVPVQVLLKGTQGVLGL